MKTDDERAEAIAELLDELDEYLTDIHDLSQSGTLVSPDAEGWKALWSILNGILDLKFRPDCDRWIPVRIKLRPVAERRDVGFKYMPRGDWSPEGWDESLKVALRNIKLAIKEYEHLQAIGRPEEDCDG